MLHFSDMLVSKVQYARPISSYCFYKDICPSPNLYHNLLQLPILHLYGARGVNTLMSKMLGSWSLPQKLSAAMSGRAPSSLFADPSVRCLPVSG